MSRVFDRIQQELFELQRRNCDDRVGVTVGRAAQMLRMTRRAVWNYVLAGELRGEQIEGAEVRGRRRVQQLVLRKGEVRRFRQALEDRGRRLLTSGPQLALPLRAPKSTVAAGRKPIPWPRTFQMAKAELRKAKPSLHDREVKPTQNSKRSGRVA